ncbi:MAG: uroporphyrinogen-III synthase [Chromatocurvus sp.]
MAVSESVLVTRPAGQADGLRAGLLAAGYRSVHQPLLTVSPIGLDAAQQAIPNTLASYAHCLFISSNAARYGLACLLAERSGWPHSVQCYAVGDSTADVLRAAGVAVQTPGVEMTSEGLLALPSLQSVSGERVLIVKGEGGRTALREALIARGAQVDELRCYRRSPPDVAPEALQQLLLEQQVVCILISSGEALDNLVALLTPVDSTHSTHRSCALVVPSARVAEQARAAGWYDVAVAANASDDAMLSALREWDSKREVTGG